LHFQGPILDGSLQYGQYLKQYLISISVITGQLLANLVLGKTPV